MAGSMSVQIQNYSSLLESLKDIEGATERAVRDTVKDMKARAPGWIASCVTAVYNIKKSEITPAGSKPKKMAGTIKVTGETIETAAITYTGRLLTPTHFGMTPKAPPPGKKYTLKMQVIKGSRKTIGDYSPIRIPGGAHSERSGNILMPTGAARADGVPYIPFQRMSKDRLDLKKFTTISMPQMITSDKVAPQIQERLSTGLTERLNHNIERQLNK